MSDLIDLKDVTSLVVALDTQIATKEKILDMLGDWRPIVTTDSAYYSEHKLLPFSCHNCGGRIDKDTLLCCYCGTYYM